MSVTDLMAAVAEGAVAAYGMPPAFAAHLVARLSTQERIVVVTADDATARGLASDIAFFVGADRARAILRIPAIDTSPYAELRPDRAALMDRMAALFRLTHHRDLAADIVVLSARSLMRRTLPRAELDNLTDVVQAGQDVDRDDTLALLSRAGYARTPVVEDPGTFAVRGGVIDLFPPIYDYPVRIELFGDEVETLRHFDPQTQRTLRDLAELYVHPVRETIPTTDANPRARIFEAADAAAHPSKQTRKIQEAVAAGEEFVGIETLTPAFHARMSTLAEYLPLDRWVLLDTEAIHRAAADELDVETERYHERLGDHKIAFPPGEHFLSSEELAATIAAVDHRIESGSVEYVDAALPAVRVDADGNQALRAELERARQQHADELMRPLVDALAKWRKDGWRVMVASDSARRRDQLAGLLADYDVGIDRRDAGALAFTDIEPGGLPVLVTGRLSHGFSLPAERVAVLTEDDIFGERRRATSRQRAAARRAKDALLGGVADFSELNPGDFLVHDLHGVGEYRGLKKLPLQGQAIDFLHLQYDGGTLYLPVYRIGEVQRYVGVEGRSPRIDKLGGQTWERTKRKVRQNVQKLAEDLLKLYAQRAALPGHAFPETDNMFREFEATFEFEETPDQQTAIDDVVADMERAKPMDRLVCGDVGYGKTEVALRAALKAVSGNKQVAVLAPTTVLVEQHYLNFQRRFAAWPITVAKLSRFQSRKHQLETVKRIAAGGVDIAIGTHRLLSNDVRFRDLGLIIVDEEQRFGVAHKERLKKMKALVDCLTLTATPIPRTLHMAMVGLREISIIATPPADRRSIRTFVSRVDDGVLREGLRRELGRGGQAFFVCPRIANKQGSAQRSMGEWADHLQSLVPEARIATAHGQMDSDALERVMIAFVDHDYDVLVSTTIIENGIDIPRANTMFVDRAEMFGLSQLYQLRGRIGRSNRRAFCYLLAPPAEKLTDDAKRRLEALQRFSELGAGFNIASHDLEIRGAGDLLGAKQSGSISAVGFESYTRLLEDAVAQLKGEAIDRPRDPELNTDAAAYIPDDYVPDTGQRLDLYKRLSAADDEDEVSLILDEITDRYGVLPIEVAVLGDLMILKSYARRLRATTMDLSAGTLSLALAEDTPLAPDAVLKVVNTPNSAYRLTPDSRLQRVFSTTEREELAASARSCLLELLGYATQSRQVS